MSVDLDELERLAKAAITRGLPGDRMMFALKAMDPEGMLALIAEVRALREDAERYRYLRERRFYYADNPNTSMYHKAGVDSGYLHVKTIDREGLDAAIDVARKEKA
jgi:hypothetical protein